MMSHLGLSHMATWTFSRSADPKDDWVAVHELDLPLQEG